MAVWTVKVGNSGILNLSRVMVEHTLNGLGIYEVRLEGVDSTQRAEIQTNKTITIYRDSTLLISGVVYNAEFYEGGGATLSGFNNELELVEQKCPVDSGKHTKIYNSTDGYNANLIFADLVGGASGWSSDVAGSTATAVSSFRTSDNMSIWDGIIQLLKLTGKDVYFNNSTKTAYLTDKKGTANTFHFREGYDISEIMYKQTKPKASKVIVYGKGDGEAQIIGTAGSGTPVFTVLDKNIQNTTEANNRATKELALISSAIKHYNFRVLDITNPVVIGDTGKITSATVGLNAEAVDCVRTKRGMGRGGIEYLEIEVTNDEFRIASISRTQSELKSLNSASLSDSAMQGTTNVLTYDNIRNANSSAGLTIMCPIPREFVRDEAGNDRILSITVDYDVDPFNAQYGTVTATDDDPDVEDDSGDNYEHSIAVESDAAIAGADISGSWESIDNSGTITSHGERITFYYNLNVTAADDPDDEFSVFLRIYNGTSSFPSSDGIRIMRGVIEYDLDIISDGTHNHGAATGAEDVHDHGGAVIPDGYHTHVIDDDGSHSHTGSVVIVPLTSQGSVMIPLDPYGLQYELQVETTGQNVGEEVSISGWWGWVVESLHKHDEGTYNAILHDHEPFAIGDSVSDESAINATSVNLYLDYYENKAITNNETAGAGVTVEMANTGRIAIGDVVYFSCATPTNNEWCTVTGVSTNVSITVTLTKNKVAGDLVSWVNKHSILTTGKTLDTDVDISDTDTYPDIYGYWRVRIVPNSATADLVMGVVKVKHQMDN